MQFGEPAHPRQSSRLSWIGIELVDEHGAALPHRRCIVGLPDGQEVDMKLDHQGKLMLRGIAAGDCRVSFPEFSDETWSQATMPLNTSSVGRRSS